MLDSFLYSLNIVAPIFIIVVLGAVLGRFKFFGHEFLSACDNLVFKICLPCLLFQDIATVDIAESFNGKLMLFSIGAVGGSVILLCLTVPLFVKDKAKCGAFVQGTFRSNAAILGVTLAANMFGDAGVSIIAMILPVIVTLFNVFAVIILSIYAPAESKLSVKELVLRILKSIVTNPLIISIVLALLWQLLPIEMPLVLDRSLSYLADMSMPLALISLGANFKLESLRGRVGTAVLASLCKTVIVPVLCVFAAIMLGFSGVELGIVFIILGGPTAVSSYIMAKQMKSDHELAAQILLISTLMSVFTLFIGIFLLKEFNLI